jgi:ABC-type Fe3+/spermidine/putrescine transport system ATPase subunit
VSRQEGLTVLHVTHDRAEAFALADTCALLVDGTLRQTGRPQDVLRRPADEAVARFLGARNILRALRDESDPRLAQLSTGASLRVAEPLPAATVDLIVRPEDVEVWPAGAAPVEAANRLTGTVVRLVLQGGHVLVGAEDPTPLEALVTARRADVLGLRIGVAVELTIASACVHAIPTT